MAANLLVHPAFYRRVRHYRYRIGIQDGRPQIAVKFVNAAQRLFERLSKIRGAGMPLGLNLQIWQTFSAPLFLVFPCSRSSIVGTGVRSP
jgi:hypothetical protein